MGAVAGELAAGGSVVGEACHQGACGAELEYVVGDFGDHGGGGGGSYQASGFDGTEKWKSRETNWFDDGDA